MKQPVIDHCVIAVTDWGRSNRFYRDVLGAEVIPIGAGWAYRFGQQQLNVHGPGVPGGPNAHLPVPPGGSDLCFEWPGAIQDAIAHLRAQHVAIEVGPVPRQGAKGRGTSVYFRNPDRSLLEFISYASPNPTGGPGPDRAAESGETLGIVERRAFQSSGTRPLGREHSSRKLCRSRGVPQR